MDAVVLSLLSAVLFGAMTVAIRRGYTTSPEPVLASLTMTTVAFAVTGAVALPAGDVGAVSAEALWPFALAGLLAPGFSQLLFTRAVAEAGPSRTSVVVGTAPLVSVAMALAFLREPVDAALIAGALLIVLGGIALASERDRPEHFRLVGLGLAFAATIFFSTRDNLVRWLSEDSDATPIAACAVTLLTGAALALVFVLAGRERLSLRRLGRSLRAFALAGLLFGLSYAALFEAYYRGRVTVVSPLVATESLWGVTLSALFLGRSELVGKRLVLGAALVVAGGALIGATS